MPDYCPHYSKIAYKASGVTSVWTKALDGTKTKRMITLGEDIDAVVARLRCKRWSCDYCADKNRAVWRAFLHERLSSFVCEFRLVTLTPTDANLSQLASYKQLQKGVKLLLQRIRRLFGEITYVRVWEAFPTNTAIHAHFIMGGLSPFVAYGANVKHRPMFLAIEKRPYKNGIWSLQTWLKRNADECGLGYMADAKNIPRGKAVNYVTKYLTKEGQAINIDGIRRVQTSRDIGGLKEALANGWSVADFITARDFKPNAKILDMQTGEIIDNNYWEQRTLYPHD